jgi:hypothetical protein
LHLNNTQTIHSSSLQKQKQIEMAKIIDLTGGGIKGSIMKSVLKKRNTFWQMMRCMALLKYKPSLMLVSGFVLMLAYFIFISPLSLFRISGPASLLDEAIVLFIFLKILSSETNRFIRYKAQCRRCD